MLRAWWVTHCGVVAVLVLSLLAVLGCRPGSSSRETHGPPGSKPTGVKPQAGGRHTLNDPTAVALEFLNAAAEVVADKRYEYKNYDIGDIIERRIRAGAVPKRAELDSLLARCFPKLRKDLRRFELGPCNFNLLLRWADRRSGADWYADAVEEARQGAAHSERGIAVYLDLAEALALAGEYRGAEHVVCEASEMLRKRPRSRRRHEEAKEFFERVGRMWSRGAPDTLFFVAINTVMLAPERASEVEPAEDDDGEDSQDALWYSCKCDLLAWSLPVWIRDRYYSLEEGRCEPAKVDRPPAEWEGDGQPSAPPLSTLARLAAALGAAAPLAEDWDSKATLRTYQAVELLAAQQVDGAVALLGDLPRREGSSALDAARGAAVLGLAQAALDTKRADLLLAAERLAETVSEDHFLAIAYRRLAIGAFQLRNRTLADSWVKRSLKHARRQGGFYGPFNISRLGMCLVALGERERGLALLEEAAKDNWMGKQQVATDFALLAEQRKDPSLLEQARHILYGASDYAPADIDVYLAMVQARCGGPQEAIQSLLDRVNERKSGSMSVRDACRYIGGLLELGDPTAGEALISRVLADPIKLDKSKSDYFRECPAEYVAATLAHRAAVTQDTTLMRRALAIAIAAQHPCDVQLRCDIIEYATYLARRTADAQLVRDAIALASTIKPDKNKLDGGLWSPASRLGYCAGSLLDERLIDEVAAWASTQPFFRAHFWTYLYLADGILDAAGKAPAPAIAPRSRVDELPYADRDYRVKWVRLPTDSFRQIFADADERLPEPLPLDVDSLQ
jgi:hypothetical protein